MERTDRKMIIEFNGLPGTGKTTVANALKEYLEKQGFVCASKECFKESNIKRYFSYLFDGSIKLYFLGKKYADRASGSPSKEKRKIIWLLISYYRLYRFFQKHNSKDILIIDQGIIQALISIIHTDILISTKELENIFKFFRKKNIDFLSVCCRTDVELSVERIISRNSFGGRLDRAPKDELYIALDNQSKNFAVIRDCAKAVLKSKAVSIDTRESFLDNTLMIYNVFLKGEQYE